MLLPMSKTALDLICTNQRDAVRLWNIIDCQGEPEAMWYGMMITIPWAFANTANFMSIKAA